MLLFSQNHYITSLKSTFNYIYNTEANFFPIFPLFIGDDLLEFHQAVVSTLRDADDVPMPLDPAPLPPNSSHPHSHSHHQLSHHTIVPHSSEDMARISETHTDITEHTDTDEADNGKLTV
jgi:hypothetical protein